MRRLPVFLLVDLSESMAGENLRLLQDGLDQLVRTLRSDPYALETAHLSVIGFAGKARTMTPLVELIQFYPPRLPLGSGTSLGGAMNHLMNELESSIQRSTAEVKGDWRPIVFLLTDGKPTDDIEPAAGRWHRDFAHRANLVGIGIGRHASLSALNRFTDTVLQLDASSPADFMRFIDWVSRSVSAQSRSVSMSQESGISLAKLDESIMSKIQDISQAATIDEDFVIIAGKCQTTKLPYLMKYEKSGVGQRAAFYGLTGVYPAEKDYYDLSDERVLTRTVNSDLLVGAPSCPHCGNRYGLAACSCGQVFCVDGDGDATCPGCNRQLEMGSGDEGFDISRARG